MQQSENLNSINNNNKNNNRSHDDVNDPDFNINNTLRHQMQPNPFFETNNNDNDRDHSNNLGPETNVDAILDDKEFMGGEKERSQMEFKETADVIDFIEMQRQGDNPSNTMFGALENKIFDEIFPESEKNSSATTTPLENEMITDKTDEIQDEQHLEFGANKLAEKIDNIEHVTNFLAHERTADLMVELISNANNDAFDQEKLPSGELDSLNLFLCLYYVKNKEV